MLVLEGLVGLHRTVPLHITSRGIDLGYCDIEWFVLETNRVHSVVFEIASKYCISDSFVDHDGYSISSEGFLPAVVDIMVMWVKSPIPVHFSSLIPRMSTFTLAISFEHFQFALIRGPVFLQITFLNDVCYMFGLHRGTVEETTDSIHYHVY